ncbi:GTP 3',8-cyclase MoaA [Hyphobacterium marinum]|uniref:GTP 3',8-cyclase n=1 Tax=Hyphobacterium marinum TaxID=3116574 RepID=A0ABU7M2Q3_9PROT|nr:GTP 3',8-cyclase MoaA [Hyphobacterium sp. Y6023]MEE2567685.1 GTP 3',8-cyclase MoaA [Hyphobacterium sp. Y6023]
MDRGFEIGFKAPLVDTFGRQITYLRLSVTDRCDLRCVYCMKARPEFLPKADLLSLEELTTICDAFIARGVTKIRVTGGEPLVRRDVMTLIENLGARIGRAGLEEVCLSTNATQLPRFAQRLADAGVKRINVSLDTLDPGRFSDLTRGGKLTDTLAGIDAAQAAGLNVKINAVALTGANETEIPDMITWAHGRAMDLTLIEVMPMGEVEADRADQFLSLGVVRDQLAVRWTLTDLPDRTGGPARYVRVEETGGRVGFITPLTGNFCAGCNRVRVTCTGELFMCLGRDGKLDLREALRAGGRDAVDALLDRAMDLKPEAHDFRIERGASSGANRDMARTGG